jgi:hypothetical protein
VNRGEHAFSVQAGMDSDLMQWAMSNAEAIAEQPSPDRSALCALLCTCTRRWPTSPDDMSIFSPVGLVLSGWGYARSWVVPPDRG